MASTYTYELSEYEKKRHERIKKNEEFLKKLGLDKYSSLMRTKKSAITKPKKVVKKVIKSTKKRRSGRLAPKNNMVMLELRQVDGVEKVVAQANSNDDGEKNYNNDEKQESYRPPTRRVSIDLNKYILTDKDREYLAASSCVDENYLSKLQEYLELVGISKQNIRNVMRQARKLASGEGIRYEVRIVIKICSLLTCGSCIYPDYYSIINFL